MRRFAAHLVFCAVFALPTLTLGQAEVREALAVRTICSDEPCLVAPWFKGEGGFLGEIADDVEEVVFVATCGNGLIAAAAEVNASHMAAQLFTFDNGIACDDYGELQIHGLKEGAWYWISDGDNVALASLVPEAVLASRQVPPADPGSDDISLISPPAGGATMIRQQSTGRVGILSHLLPQAPLPVCGLHRAEDETPYQLSNDCTLDARFVLKVTGAGGAEVGSTVYRNAAGDVRLTANMFGVGHISNRQVGNGDTTIDPEYGAVPEKPLSAAWSVALHDGSPGATLADFGIAQDATNPNEVVVSPAAYCVSEDPAERAAAPRIRISASYQQNFIVPEMPNTTPPTTFDRFIRIHCPQAAAQRGRELVPENPFPLAVD